MSGKGISEEVRKNIPNWLDPMALKALSNIREREYLVESRIFKNWITYPENWVRKNRSKGINGTFTRTYINKATKQISLKVYTDKTDSKVEGYVFYMEEKAVVVNVPQSVKDSPRKAIEHSPIQPFDRLEIEREV